MSVALTINQEKLVMREKFFNLFIDNINTEESLALFDNYLDSNQNHHIYFINAHCFNLAQSNKKYFEALNHADLLLNDGIGVKLASKIYGLRLKENMNGTDLIPKIIRKTYQRNEGIYLLGGAPGVAEEAAERLRRKHEGIKISGFHDGYFSQDENKRIIQSINESGAKLLVLGMGVPLQELWIHQHSHELKNIRISIAGGAILDFISKRIKRAPRFMRKTGLEWFYRFYLEPDRMFKRYFQGAFIFLRHIFRLRKEK